MKLKIWALLPVVFLALAGISHAADEPASLGTQAGEAARELKAKADEGLSTGAAKLAESSQKIGVEAQQTMKTLQEQWNEFVKQFQEKAQQLQNQLMQQWQDFNKSFNKSSNP